MRRNMVWRSVTIAAALVAAAPVALLAANGKWASDVAATEGGHRMGNPQAATSLVMFVSYSCPHCGDFEKQAEAPLLGSVESGRMSVEVRHVIRNPIDLAAALATECGPQGEFFARHNAMFAAQERWLDTAIHASPEMQKGWSTGPLAGRMKAIAADLDFYAVMQAHGLPRATLDACLADEAKARQIATTSQAQGQKFAIPGTPSFMVNGKLLPDVHSWPGLQGALGEALAPRS